MDYCLKDVIEGMMIPLNMEVPPDLEKLIIDSVLTTNSDFMQPRELCILMVENWLNNHALADYEYEQVEEYVISWYDDFIENWREDYQTTTEVE